MRLSKQTGSSHLPIRDALIKTLLFILASPPDAVLTLESLEAAMVAAVFDRSVSILFRQEGVRCFQSAQVSNGLSRIHELIEQLHDYEIDKLYACAESLRTHGLTSRAVELGIVQMDLSAQATLISSQDAVVPG